MNQIKPNQNIIIQTKKESKRYIILTPKSALKKKIITPKVRIKKIKKNLQKWLAKQKKKKRIENGKGHVVREKENPTHPQKHAIHRQTQTLSLFLFKSHSFSFCLTLFLSLRSHPETLE